MTPNLIKVSEIFLVPSSFLVAALGTADTYPHKAAVSVVGLIVSILWLICAMEALSDSGPRKEQGHRPRRVRVLGWLPIVFISGWLLSVVIHAQLWWTSVPR